LIDPSHAVLSLSLSVINHPVQAIHAFAEQHKHFPRPWNEQDAADVLKIADQINSQAKQVLCRFLLQFM
jgi:hypothetical protein